MSNSVNSTTELILTDNAKNYIKQLMSENNIPIEEYFLRITVKSNGRSGFTYQMGFDKEQQNSDTIFEYGKIKISVDGKSLFYLMGTELDYKNDSTGRGFVFNNPNESSSGSSCGCSV
jgi:iron-sulfur cluster assembly protein